MSARIESLVGLAMLQGPPLTGYRRFGVPPGGAFDQGSYRLAEAMAGNAGIGLAIELSNAEIEIAFGASTRVAVVGAAVEIDLAAANSAFDVRAGERLRIRAPRTGLRAYLSVFGGWVPDGIDSPLARSGRRLAVGDVLEHGERVESGVVQRLADPPESLAEGPIRIVEGPQSTLAKTGARIAESAASDLDSSGFQSLEIAGKTLIVSNSSDRTGIRLDGFAPAPLPELVSEPACLGAIQLTPSGQLIVIGPDGPTIGGYPKVAVVCLADLDRLAQFRPGQGVTLRQIDLDAARLLAADRELRLARKASQIGLTLG